MQTKLDGIIISKTAYQERHLIAQLLLRSGKRISVLFYGGLGGGKKMKVSGLELGHLVKLELNRGKTHQEMYTCKEWMVSWSHDRLRNTHQAFWVMCFFLEVTRALAGEDSLHDANRDFDQSGEGLFRVLSNALVHLEQSLERDNFNHLDEIVLFLGKQLIEQGIFPERRHCVLSGEEITANDALVLFSERGGFAKSSYVGSDQGSGTHLWGLLGVIANQKYAEVNELGLNGAGACHALLDYFCYQLQFQKKQFKSLALLV